MTVSAATPRWMRVLVIAVFVVFVAGIGFLAVRDSQAEDRCHAIGGQTWDSGGHCVIGGRIVSTR